MRELLWGGVTWTTGEGVEKPLNNDDILQEPDADAANIWSG